VELAGRRRVWRIKHQHAGALNAFDGQRHPSTIHARRLQPTVWMPVRCCGRFALVSHDAVPQVISHAPITATALVYNLSRSLRRAPRSNISHAVSTGLTPPPSQPFHTQDKAPLGAAGTAEQDDGATAGHGLAPAASR